MGSLLDASRETKTDFESVTKNRTLEFWNDPIYVNKIKLGQIENQGTLPRGDIVKACEIIKLFFKEHNIVKPKILEIGSGNGFNTKIIYEELRPFEVEIIATDYVDFNTKYFNVEPNMLSQNAVKKYNGLFDILLLVSPLPFGYMDYYAIKEYELQENSKEKFANKFANKFVIFIGELGASDGAAGMFKYMLFDSCWKCIYREMIYREYKSDFIGFIEKEIFIFSNKT